MAESFKDWTGSRNAGDLLVVPNVTQCHSRTSASEERRIELQLLLESANLGFLKSLCVQGLAVCRKALAEAPFDMSFQCGFPETRLMAFYCGLGLDHPAIPDGLHELVDCTKCSGR